ncbi:MAG TPA: UrcA family protein [Caulobacteraceae bacterium]
MNTSMLTLAISASALLLVAAPAASASAETAQTSSAIVKYSDLNLSSHDGAKAMYQRLKMTARNLCGDEPDIRDIGAQASWRTCVNDSVDSAVGRLNDKMVASFNGGRPASLVKLAETH